jgi:hypothetical protein
MKRTVHSELWLSVNSLKNNFIFELVLFCLFFTYNYYNQNKLQEKLRYETVIETSGDED